MWKLLILLGFIGCGNPVAPTKSTYYPVNVGMEWTYQKYDPGRASFDTIVITVIKKDIDTFYCTIAGKYYNGTMYIVRNHDTVEYWFPNSWPIVLTDGKEGDTWDHGKDYYEILDERPLIVLGTTYHTIQTYRFGLQEAVYWAGKDIGIVKMFYGAGNIWNLISVTRSIRKGDY